jgi:hypothetical protein
MIQIRNVLDSVHSRLKSRGALAGMSLSAYLLKQLCALADQPAMEKLRVRLERLPPFEPSVPLADAIRAERGRL